MKKLLFVALFIGAFNIAKSQDITYTPFFRDTPHQNQQQYQPQQQSFWDTPRQNQQQYQTQQQSQRLRTTAYTVDYNGNYTKIPIQVTVTIYIYPTGNTGYETKVTSYYRNNGYGGQWENCIGARVQQCQSIFGNEMEQIFMFKANLLPIGWIYFDL